MSWSPGAGENATVAGRPVTAVDGGAGTSRPVPSARSVALATALPGIALSATNGQLGPYPPASVPSSARAVQLYWTPSVKAAAGTVVVNAEPVAAIAESGGSYWAGMPFTCQWARMLSKSGSDSAARSVTPLVVLTCGAEGPHGYDGSIKRWAEGGVSGAR